MKKILLLFFSLIIIASALFAQASNPENLQRVTAKEIGNNTRSSDVVITNIKRKATNVTWDAQAGDACYECDADDMVRNVHIVKVKCANATSSLPQQQQPYQTQFERASSTSNYPMPDFDNVPYYYEETTNTLLPLEKANYHVESKVKGLFGAEQLIVVPNSASRVRFSSSQNIQFIIHFDDSRTEPSTLFQLIPFTINTKNNNNQREYLIGSKGLGHSETNEKQIAMLPKKIGDGLYLLSFVDEIPVGEFAITIEKTKQGYAFGIDAGGTKNYAYRAQPKEPARQVENTFTPERKAEDDISANTYKSPMPAKATSIENGNNSKPVTEEEEMAQLEAKLKALKERKAKEEAARLEAERKAEEEAKRKAKEEAEKKAAELAKIKEAAPTEDSGSEKVDSLAIFRAVMKQMEEQKKAEDAKRLAEEAEARRIDSLVEVKVRAQLAAVKANSEFEIPKIENFSTPNNESGEALFNNPIVKSLDAMCRKYISDSLKADWIYENLNNGIKKMFDYNHTKDVEIRGYQRYSGEKNNGKWQGKGFLIVQNMWFYDGYFENDNFIKGIALLKYANGNRYIGEYEKEKPYGFGRFTYLNGNLSIGNFGANGFEKGIIHKVDEGGNYYFGETTSGKKDGSGVFVTAKGNQYIGVFKNDQLQNGYSVQADDFGGKSFFEVTDFVKKTIDSKDWEKFAAEYTKLKTRYHM